MTTQPQPAPPEVPAWAVKAAREISLGIKDLLLSDGVRHYRAPTTDEKAAIIARHYENRDK